MSGRNPASNRTKAIKADSFPQRCPQTQPAPQPEDDDYSGNEDCLFLSVYSPAQANATNLLPVFFWIHGGGYGRGQGNQDIAEFSRINDNRFVSVVIQYRLGALGFLAGDEVYRFGDVNAGLLDQQFAMQWVQKHIRKFGGDPSRVTIAGQSAGAGAVMHHAVSFDGRLGTKLFKNAIAATPYNPLLYRYNDWQPAQAYYSLALAAGCFPGRGYGNSSATILECLRATPSNEIQKAGANVGASGIWGAWTFLPVIDGEFVPGPVSSQLQSGKLNGLRVISGNTASEAAAYVIPEITSDAELEAWLRLEYPLLTEENIDEILRVHYPSSNPSDIVPFATCGDCNGATADETGPFAIGPQQRAIALYSESTFVCSSYWLAEAYSCGKGRDAWKYQYSVPAAQHGADLNGVGLRPKGPILSSAFVRAFGRTWGNFIVNNNPSSEQKWPTFNEHGDRPWRMLNLNETGGSPYSSRVVATMPNATQYEGPGLANDIRVVDANTWEGGRGKRCEFWRQIGDRVPFLRRE
ncbi:Lipase 2 [Pseudocercospora fuligena]|uniref:Carboxylic ester hydrolase n=1 Tax=Pseudocercospora fuligena TaxID=685502 RepID=A0A8H6VJ45_9PEZI|nr:Lipase 2 [Pseudocercospora fuligena]